MRDLTAVKPLVYASRRLMPGDDFTTRSNTDARVLIAVGRAVARRKVGTIPPPSREVSDKIISMLDHDGDGKPGGSVAPEQTDDLKALRDEYREVIGKRAFPGWDADTLREKIAAAKG